MEKLNFLWQQVQSFLEQRENLVMVLWAIFALSWLVIGWQLASLPYKLKKIKKEWRRRRQGLVFQDDGFFIKLKKIKL